MKLLSSSDASGLQELEEKLIRFYQESTDYTAFQKPSRYPPIWNEIIESAKQMIQDKGSCSILEAGAGRSGFGEYLHEQNIEGVNLTSQDVTDTNREFLGDRSDHVYVGMLDELDQKFDIVFHTYVFEHIVRPWEFLKQIHDRQDIGGFHFIQCPCYGLPFYLPPACDHLGMLGRAGMIAKFWLRDIGDFFGSKPNFTILDDPAVLHMPFHRDRDVVNRVTYRDITRFYGSAAKCEKFVISSSGLDKLTKTLLVIRLKIQKIDDL